MPDIVKFEIFIDPLAAQVNAVPLRLDHRLQLEVGKLPGAS